MSTILGEVITFAENSGNGIMQSFIQLSTTWTGAGPYTQSCTATGCTITPYSKVDLQPDTTILSQLMEDGVQAMYIENDNGDLTCYALNAAPTTAITIQCTVTEVKSNVSENRTIPSAEGMSF